MGKYWRQLHKLTYVVVILGWLHLLWITRSDIGDALLYGAIFLLLLLYRVQIAAQKRFARLSREANRPELLVNSQLCRIKRISA